MNNFQQSLAKYAVYFEELRKKLFLLTKIFVIVFAIGFFATSSVVKFMMNHLDMGDVTIVTTSPFQLIDLAMSVGFFSACIVTVPIFIFNLYSFLKSGLLIKERKIFFLSLPISILLFIMGFLYGCGMLYYAIKLVARVNVSLGVVNYWDISLFISQIVMTSSILGLLFVFPLVMTFLIKLGITTVDFLKSKRRHAMVIILIIVSLLPPTDGLSLIIMSVPLVLLFEVTVLFNRNKNGRNLII